MFHVLSNFGRYIEELRAEKSVTVEELAQHLEVTPGTIKRWIANDYKNCTLDRICQILKVLC